MTPELFLAALAILNAISFALVYIDKRKSINKDLRIPEVDFFVWAIFFSSIGVLAGMFVFRHKTQKLNFVLGIGLLCLQHLALAYFIFQNTLS
jgi:uncharacterized membrane protein YsdA (DUF1294 family)